MKILVVDDAKAVHSFVKALFADLDHNLVSVFDGQQAVDSVRAENFDLVLMDWEMPVKDGCTAVIEIRSFNKDLPIIMTTSLNEISNITMALEQGANEYVMKPYTKDILFGKIEQVLGRPVD